MCENEQLYICTDEINIPCGCLFLRFKQKTHLFNVLKDAETDSGIRKKRPTVKTSIGITIT